ARLARRAQPRDDVEPEGVRQVEVEQHEVGLQLGDEGDRLVAGGGGADDLEARDALDEAAVDARHHEVVVDDEHPDHRFSSTAATDSVESSVKAVAGPGPGSTVSRATNFAPVGVLSTSTSPPRRWQ